jgi:hypothetical protein
MLSESKRQTHWYWVIVKTDMYFIEYKDDKYIKP